MIKDETFVKFKEAMKTEHNIVFGISEARSILQGLVNYYDLLAKIDSRK